ncbi:MAG: 3-deoxy-D-manno-octulosonic acid transferase [Desulfuromonas sp.]|uniref:3-deoxy-D-manno-octulosonic acid transferase n=1 Tax=Desulfuromonas sp. TaxID=892 RepID=UPI000CC45F16|nr:3-deoxy-D-manno-octulosonic acid transferase [Desulfuromonas sp.]PLX85971.1 MAG: 3-deoxy-D-manno-octulosonic acid transferase [Desulfuromonas sp.]
MVYLLYDLILLFSALFLIPYYLLRGLRRGKVRRGIRERLGFFLPGQLDLLEGRTVFWVHAVSVGETRAAIPLLKALKAAYPDCALVLSNVTETGQAVAREIAEADLCLFFPFDLSWVVRRVLRRVRPSLAVIVETEIWPNFVRMAHKEGIPVALVNGRISDRSFPRYRMARTFLRPVLEQFSVLCMQTEQDAERIVALGARQERVEVTRNLKFDMQAAVPDEAAAAGLKAAFRVPQDALVWVAGSTHAGEEEDVVSVFRELAAEEAERCGLVLVLVPRHPERCGSVGDLLQDQDVPFVLRSEVEALPRALAAGEVLLVDSVGEMLKFIAVADLVFVGGSLVPVGGHNVLEAGLLGKPVVFGPHMNNFREIAHLVLQAQGGLCVDDRAGLKRAVRTLLDREDMRLAMGKGGQDLVRQHAGATEATLATLRRILGD